MDHLTQTVPKERKRGGPNASAALSSSRNSYINSEKEEDNRKERGPK